MFILLAVLCYLSSAVRLAPLLYAPEIDAIADNYIVVYKEDTLIATLNQDIATLGIRPSFTYEHVFTGFAANLTAVQITALRQNPSINFIEQDQIVRATACSPRVAVTSWGLTRISERTKMSLDGFYTYPTTAGSGVTAYVIDTGIYVDHNDFGGRASFGWKADNSWSNSDGNGHGTHVTGTIIGATYGIARAAKAVAVKVLGDDGSGTNSGVLAGVNWVISQYNNAKKPSVINMSLGGGISTALNLAVDAAVDSGIVVAVAAGNSNTNACSSSPASASRVISVGSTDVGISNTDVRSYFSNYGDCVKVFAPGSDITSAWIGSKTAKNTISGTSMASPHVAGIAALKLGDNPTGKAIDIQNSIIAGATNGVIQLQCSNTACNKSPNLLAWNGCTK
jgi:subtilisin family serine protease